MTQSNLKIAVTGGIGSGKSSVASVLRNLGFKVVSFDEIYSRLLKTREFIGVIAANFPGAVVKGEVDRKTLSKMVFENREMLELLNNISHPEIYKCAFSEGEDTKVCFYEVPLLFEDGAQSRFDEVIVVLRDLQERIKSAAIRSKISKKQVQNRIKNQINYDLCDFSRYYVIHNNGTLSDLWLKVCEVVQSLKEKYRF